MKSGKYKVIYTNQEGDEVLFSEHKNIENAAIWLESLKNKKIPGAKIIYRGKVVKE